MLLNINDYKNIHSGRSVVVAGSGPSLRKYKVCNDTTRFSETITINDAVSFLPEARYSFLCDPKPLALFGPRCLSAFTTTPGDCGAKVGTCNIRFLGRWGGHIEVGEHGVIAKYKVGTYDFSLDLNKGIFVGNTTAHAALQLAVWMGFTTVYLVGIDLADEGNQTHFNGTWNHSGDRKVWFEECQEVFRQCKELIPKHIKVYNCSPIRGPDAFEKLDICQI